jgi:hypothetical protein
MTKGPERSDSTDHRVEVEGRGVVSRLGTDRRGWSCDRYLASAAEPASQRRSFVDDHCREPYTGCTRCNRPNHQHHRYQPSQPISKQRIGSSPWSPRFEASLGQGIGQEVTPPCKEYRQLRLDVIVG